MEEVPNQHIAKEIVSAHYKRFAPSLSQFSERYLSKFYVNPSEAAKHIAYLCPICINTGFISTPHFDILWHNEFSKDHFPPESVGGGNQLLVCKVCNNNAGGNYENELKKLMSIRAYNKKIPSATLNVKYRVKNLPGNYNSQINIRPDGSFGINVKPNEKSKVPPLDNWIKQSKSDNNWVAELTVTDADEGKVTRALLKAAYLYCFDLWGYEFIYSETGDKIRQVLNSEIDYPLKMPSFWLTDIVTKGSLPAGVYFLTAPEYRSFLVVMELAEPDTGYRDLIGVIIPGPFMDNWNELTELQINLDKNEHANVSVTMQAVIRDTLDNGIFDGYTKSWEWLMGKS